MRGSDGVYGGLGEVRKKFDRKPLEDLEKDVPEVLSGRMSGSRLGTWNSEGNRVPFHGAEAATEFRSDWDNLGQDIGPSPVP